MKLRFSPFLLVGALSTTVLAVTPTLSRADDFAPIAAGDPIYEQLSTLSRATKTPKTTVALTRYEVALQTARVIFSVTEDSKASAAMTRDGWKALRELVAALRPELRKMEVDVAPALVLADRALKAPIGTPVGAPKMPVKVLTAPMRMTPPPGTPRPTLPSFTGGMGNALAFDNEALESRGFSLRVPLSQRLRVETAALAMQRDTADPFGDNATSFSASPLHTRGQSAGLTYDFNSWLSVRANTSRRDWSREDVAGRSPIVTAPLFAGATQEQSGGGGVDVRLGPALRFSTDLERLATNVGATGTRVGGGIGLSAWQNRLSLSAHLSRLQPDDSAALSSTATELNVGVDVTRRVTLSLLYQGLFTPQAVNNASRVGGGLS